MWELDHKEDWEMKNWWFHTLLLENTLESALDFKIKPGSKPWIVIRMSDAEAKAVILWPPDMMSLFIAKDPDAGKYWGHKSNF